MSRPATWFGRCFEAQHGFTRRQMATILLNCNRLVCQRRALRKLMCQPGGGFYGNLCLHFNGIRVPLKGGPYGFSTRNAHIIRPAEADSFSGGQVNFLKRHWWPFAITGRHSSPRNNQPPPPHSRDWRDIQTKIAAQKCPPSDVRLCGKERRKNAQPFRAGWTDWAWPWQRAATPLAPIDDSQAAFNIGCLSSSKISIFIQMNRPILIYLNSIDLTNFN